MLVLGASRDLGAGEGHVSLVLAGLGSGRSCVVGSVVLYMAGISLETGCGWNPRFLCSLHTRCYQRLSYAENKPVASEIRFLDQDHQIGDSPIRATHSESIYLYRADLHFTPFHCHSREVRILVIEQPPTKEKKS